MADDDKVDMGTNAEDRDTQSIRIPKTLNEKMKAWAKANNCDVRTFWDRMDGSTTSKPGDMQRLLDVAAKVDSIDNGPSGAGLSSAEMKELFMSKLYARLMMSDDMAGNAKGDGFDKMMERMMTMEMIRSMRPQPPPPPQRSFAEEMMMVDRMNKDPAARDAAAEEARRARDDYQKQIQEQNQSFEKQLKNIEDMIYKKDTAEELQKTREESMMMLERFQQTVTEQFRADIARIESRIGYAGGNSEEKKKAIITGVTELKDQIAAIKDAARELGFTTEATNTAIQKASEKSGVSKYTSDIKEMFDSLANAADKVGHIGGQGEIPPPPGRVVGPDTKLRAVNISDESLTTQPSGGT